MSDTDDLRPTAAEQAALRRVATLVAQAAPRAEIFEALVTEVGRLVPASDAALVRFDGDTTLTMIGRWSESEGYLDLGARHPFGSGTLAWLVSRSGRPSRIDSYAETPGSLPEMIRGWGWRSSVGAPVIVDAEVWGLTAVGSTTDRPLPPDTEQRLAEFTELLANAIANAQSREELEQLAAEQAALRRVAELAAHDAPPGDVLEEVVAQASNLVGVAFTTLVRFESDGATEVVAIHDPPEGVTVGMRAPGEGDGATQRVWRTGRTARVDRLSDVSGTWPDLAARQGYSSSAAAPILAEDRLWGVLVAAGRGSLPPHIEEQLSRFAELAGTAIAGSQARAALQTLADEQAALRRVAELVARDAAPQAVLDAVVDEASRQFGDAPTALMRHGSDGFATVVAACRGPQLLGVRIPLDGRSSTGDISRSGRPARTDDYATSDAQLVAREHGVAATVSVPVVVEDAVWGSLTVASPDAPLPAGLEDRIAQFAGLVGTAVSSAHARERLQRLADEQAALRRVAELVARGVGQDELFASVATEASQLIDGLGATLTRLEGPGQWTVMATHGGPAPGATPPTVGDGGLHAQVSRTGRPGRLDDLGVGSAVAVPIFMSTRLWGVLGVTSPDGTLPAEAEQRLEEFAGLVSAALANAQARSEVQTLADEQAALLRVAERVARGDPPDEVFATVTAEARQLLGGQPMTLTRFEEDAALVVISRSGGPAPPGTRIAYATDTLPDRVRRAASAVRVNDYSVEPDARLARDFGLAAAVAAPIAVEGRVWGMLTATSADGPLASGAEDRLQRFANLVGTAVSNATSRAQLVASRARVLSTADETRRRLQRDVHDGAQQRLVQTVISLKLAGQSLADGDVPAGRRTRRRRAQARPARHRRAARARQRDPAVDPDPQGPDRRRGVADP